MLFRLPEDRRNSISTLNLFLQFHLLLRFHVPEARLVRCPEPGTCNLFILETYLYVTFGLFFAVLRREQTRRQELFLARVKQSNSMTLNLQYNNARRRCAQLSSSRFRF